MKSTSLAAAATETELFSVDTVYLMYVAQQERFIKHDDMHAVFSPKGNL